MKMTETKKPPPPAVLVFAASDPTSGAGIQADVLTLASLGCHPLCAVTALTVQDSMGVYALHATDAALLEAQARTVLSDIPVAAFKVGMLGSIDNMAAILRILADYPAVPLILDPVLASGRGDAFLDNEGIAFLCKSLLSKTFLATPNAAEARKLCVASGTLPDPDNATAAWQLIEMGAKNILITGTDEATLDVKHTLYATGGKEWDFSYPRLDGCYHGSGCTLASAITAFVAKGQALDKAVKNGLDYTWQSLHHGFRLGAGQFIPNRQWHFSN